MADLRWSLMRGAWPKPETKLRKRSPFGATWSRTIEDLHRELDLLKVREALIEFDGAPADMRKLDGQPYADARPQTPKVRLSFILPAIGQPVVYACDTYDDWRANIRAIALTLEALRRVERYGATEAGQQYRGFAALPPAGGSTETAITTPEQAAAIIVEASDAGWDSATIIANRRAAEVAVRDAQLASHPDKGGAPGLFERVQLARKVLESHHGGDL